jgi:hypothetical protein
MPFQIGYDGLARPNGKIGEVPFREKQGKSNISVGGYECNLRPNYFDFSLIAV